MTVGEKIQYHRKKAGLSQEDLGRELLVSRQTVSLWETGQTLPTIDNLIRLKDIFGVSIDEILCEEETEKQKSEILPAEIVSQRYTEEDWWLMFREAFRPLKKKIWLSLVCTLIFLLAAAKSELRGFSSFCLGFIFMIDLIWICSYLINQKNWKTRKNLLLETDYRYEVYGDCLILRCYRENKNIYMRKIPYANIQNLRHTEQYYSFQYANELHYIFKRELKADSLLPKIFEECIPSQKILPKKKTKASAVISWFLFFAVLLSPIGALACTALLNEIKGAAAANMWPFLAFLIIPITSFIYGMRLSAKKEGGVKNIAAAILISGLLALLGSFVFLIPEQNDPQTDSIRIPETSACLCADREDQQI